MNMNTQNIALVAAAEKAGVTFKSYGDVPNWSWDRPGAAGGCGLPSKADAAFDAVRELRLSVRCACGAPGRAFDATTTFECGAEISFEGLVEQECPNTQMEMPS